MRDYFTGDKVDVRMNEKCGAYIMIEPARIHTIEELLQNNGISFALEDGSNSCIGTPEAAVIEVRVCVDHARVIRRSSLARGAGRARARDGSAYRVAADPNARRSPTSRTPATRRQARLRCGA